MARWRLLKRELAILAGAMLCCAGLALGCQSTSAEARQMIHHAPSEAMLHADQPLSGLLPPAYAPERISLLVEKARYRLTVYYGETALKSYPVVLGPDPVSDKRREGDGATPEGVFHLRNLYPHAKWSKFMWVDYPTAESWQRFEAAKAAGEIPADATIGGEIGIHGVPDQDDALIERRVNWTAGCVSLKTADIDELYAVSRKGMLVEIVP